MAVSTTHHQPRPTTTWSGTGQTEASDVVMVLGGVGLTDGLEPEFGSGDLGEAEHGLERTMELARRTEAFAVFSFAAAALARHHLSTGHPDAALAGASAALDVVRRHDGWAWGGEVASTAVEAELALNRPARAAALVDELREAVDRGGRGPAARASLRYCEGLVAQALGRWEQAAEHLRTSHAAWQDLSRPYDAALAVEQWGWSVMAVDPRAATELLVTAAESFVRLGVPRRAARIERLLARHGTGRPVSGRRSPEDLSPRERQVVRLAVQGKTNREIANLLSLSERTVESHVRHALQKRGGGRLRRGRASRADLDGLS